MREIPEKPYYKVSEVCNYTDTQPYILRFWESEFPQLTPERSRGGQSIYSKQDIDLVMRIKRLLYDEEYTIAGARKHLADAKGGSGTGKKRSTAQKGPSARKASSIRQEAEMRPSARQVTLELDQIPRERYEDALEEIAHLRLQLKEAEAVTRRTDGALRKAEQAAERERNRTKTAIARVEGLIQKLS